MEKEKYYCRYSGMKEEEKKKTFLPSDFEDHKKALEGEFAVM